MAYQLTSSAAKRIAKQLEFFLDTKQILITDTMTVSVSGRQATVVFYVNYTNKIEKHKIVYDSLSCITLIEEFYDMYATQCKRIALSKLIRVLPIPRRKRRFLLSEIKNIQFAKTKKIIARIGRGFLLDSAILKSIDELTDINFFNKKKNLKQKTKTPQ